MATPETSTARISETERSLDRQLVLDEDEYTAALSEIIARDFFPSLVHLDPTNDYLDALHSRDPNLINASIRRLQELGVTPATTRLDHPWQQTPSKTPAGSRFSETPSGDGGQSPRKRARYDTSLSLDDFQARYTSEDNSSFTQILDDENRKRRERWAWAWDAQRRVEDQRAKALEGRERMLIEPPGATGVKEKFMIQAPATVGLITDGSEEEGEGLGKGKEIVLKENEETEVDVMAPKKDTRSTKVDGWNFKTRNSLMFSPDADQSPHNTANVVNAESDPKSIEHRNTQLPDEAGSSSQVPPSPTNSRIDAAVAGVPYHPRLSAINNYSLVPNMPSPTPSELGPAAVKQLMTWGTLAGTPRIISESGDDPAPSQPSTPFHLPAPSSREVISRKLSNNASKSLRAKAGLLGRHGRTPGVSPDGFKGKGSMGPPPSVPRKADAAGNLTPAARSLLGRTSFGNRSGGAHGKEQDLNRVRWTPVPSPVAKRS